MTKKELRHLHKLLDAMLSKTEVWIQHWDSSWETTKIVNITRAGTVTVERRQKGKFFACLPSEIYFERPSEEATPNGHSD